MEVTDELIIIAVSFACGAASAWMCLENRINEINAENDFILRRKENLKFCWADVDAFIHGLREVNGEMAQWWAATLTALIWMHLRRKSRK